jgi:hypothetical protein
MGYTVIGDTIRLNAAFENFSSVAADPTIVTLTIYDECKNTLTSATTTSSVSTGSATGAFYYDYTTTNEGVHFYEFEGTLEGYTITDKGTFYVTWA